jgi:putative endonuclease
MKASPASTTAIAWFIYESFDDVRKAIDREKQLKGGRRGKKIALIESLNPRWADLAEK